MSKLLGGQIWPSSLGMQGMHSSSPSMLDTNRTFEANGDRGLGI
eukprot:CAMPEP_0180139352 /NCGR_PEP_ID=MMETSP0986-20121125/13486_1 /TAXON_ID=697907 /ORGANISM="non described non described, Strain CCMP2293" /LENGTH=43 /DNA_ID= /DNA_START= /DNA_END= /DNA_ORIENTATION=